VTGVNAIGKGEGILATERALWFVGRWLRDVTCLLAGHLHKTPHPSHPTSSHASNLISPSLQSVFLLSFCCLSSSLNKTKQRSLIASFICSPVFLIPSHPLHSHTMLAFHGTCHIHREGLSRCTPDSQLTSIVVAPALQAATSHNCACVATPQGYVYRRNA
jgi:hypothetical protein